MLDFHSYEFNDSISYDEHKKLYDSGNARYLLKHGDHRFTFINDENGWKIFDQNKNDVSEFFPGHLGKLFGSFIPEGTVLLAEMALMYGERSDPKGMEKYLDSRQNLNCKKIPIAFVYDVLFFDSQDLSDKKYSERQVFLKDSMLFGSDCFVRSEKVISANPDNWQSQILNHELDGLLLIDDSKDFKLWANDNSPKLYYELVPEKLEIAVAFAGISDKNDEVHELLLMQRRPTDGSWFFCGSINSENDVSETCKKHSMTIMKEIPQGILNEVMHMCKGFVIKVKCDSRNPTNNEFNNPKLEDLECDFNVDKCIARTYVR